MAVRVVATDSVLYAIPRKASASGLRDSGMHGIVDGQMQRIHLRATIRVGMAVRVVATDGVRCPMPTITLTCSLIGNNQCGIERIVCPSAGICVGTD